MAQDRTEKATPKRRQEARKRGQVARSREVNTGFALLTLFAMLVFAGPWAMSHFTAMMTTWLSGAGTSDGLTPSEGWSTLLQAGRTVGTITAPFAIAGAVAGVLASALQVKPGLTLEVLKPRFSAISPKNGIKRLVSPRSLQSLIKDLIKLAAVGGIAYAILATALPDLTLLLGAGPGATLSTVSSLILKLGFAFAGAYVLIAIADLIFERWQHERELRMTKEEVKREAKDADISPEVKGQLKRRQREMAIKRMMAAVPDADVVITNPTHYAVALRYARNLPAPRVVAKGADRVAQRIIDLARAHDVVVVQEPPLARSLYAAAEVGQYIPAEAFAAVAEILAYVYRLREREPAVA